MSAGVYSGRYFRSGKEAALQYQYEAALRAANAREVKRFGPMRCSLMQREAAALYEAARRAATGSAQ